MHLWELCIEVKGDNWGGERFSLLVLVVVVVVVDFTVVVDVLVFVVL